jgi:hypothetical protein
MPGSLISPGKGVCRFINRKVNDFRVLRFDEIRFFSQGRYQFQFVHNFLQIICSGGKTFDGRFGNSATNRQDPADIFQGAETLKSGFYNLATPRSHRTSDLCVVCR